MATATTPETVEKTIFEALPQFGVEESDITRESTFEELDVDSLDLAELSQIMTVGDAIDLVVSRA